MGSAINIEDKDKKISNQLTKLTESPKKQDNISKTIISIGRIMVGYEPINSYC